MGLGPLEIALIILAILLLFGYKKLPDASRSLGRSLRIFKGEMKGMKDDDVRTRAEAESVRGELDQDRSQPYLPPQPAPRPAAAPVPPPTSFVKPQPDSQYPVRSDDPR